MPRSRSAAGRGLLLVVLAALALPGAARADLPLGTDGHGASVRLVGDGVRVTLGPQRYRGVAGRRVALTCTRLEPSAPGFSAESDTTAELAAPRARRPLVFPHFVRPRADYCVLRRIRPAGDVAAVALTRRGATFLDERATARDVVGLVLLATTLHRGVATPAELQRLARGRPFLLPGPGTRPPGRRLGFWSDGKRRLYAARATDAGRLLYLGIDVESDDVATNILGFLTGAG